MGTPPHRLDKNMHEKKKKTKPSLLYTRQATFGLDIESTMAIISLRDGAAR